MSSARSRFLSAWAPVLLAAAWVVSLLSPLLSPQRALGNRDIADFHLPLRFAFRQLAAFGLPLWNPWVHGGQPLLSNPSYGAFYPPSWLVLALPPYYALSWLAVLHVALAFAGAWRLARHLGCGRGAAALAGIGYSGCGAYLSQLSALGMLMGLAWLPWLLAWTDEALRVERGERWWRPALLAGGALSLQLLNGEPSVATLSGLALLAFAASAAGRQHGARQRVQRASRVLVPLGFALAVAAVQLLPTLGRLAESPRALDAQQSMSWSMAPQRLAEVVLPRFYGDPARVAEGLFFGGAISDGHYPYVESLYPGLLLAVVGTAALLGGRSPRRAAWALALGAGVFLALGRHNPLYAGLRRVVPLLAIQRYPEKFVVLAILALVLAGALGWQRLLDERQAGRPEAANLPLALALAVLAAAATLAALLLWAPHLAKPLLDVSGTPFPEQRAAALPYLRGESWAAVATSAAVAALLGLCRWRRPQRRWLAWLAILLLAVDLWHYGHRLARTVPAALYQVPPPLAASLLPARDRVFATPEAGSDLSPLKVATQADRASLHIARLTPYAGLLWHIPYAFDVDFDLMLTHWARASDEILEHEWLQPEQSFRYLGAWNVRTVLMARRIASQPAAGADPVLLGLSRLENSHVLPRFRFVPRVTFHPSLTAAIAAARAASWTVGREEHCVQPGQPPRTLVYSRPPHLLDSADEGKRVRLHYRADEGAFFVAATTFDEGWNGRIDGAPVAVYPTAACQLGVELPPGEHRLVLEYRDPFVPVGAAVSLFALLLGIVVYRRP